MRNPEPASSRDHADESSRPAHHVSDWLSRIDKKVWSATGGGERGKASFFKRWMQILHRSFIDFLAHDGSGTASSLTYATLLSLVPLLALLMAGLTVFGVQKSAREALKNYPLIQKLAISKTTVSTPTLANAAAPAAAPAADASGAWYDEDDGAMSSSEATSTTTATTATTTTTTTTTTVAAASADDTLSGPKLVDRIFDFVDNANLKKLGPMGFVGLLWAVLMLLSKIERAMNRAWSVQRQRTFAHKIADYLQIMVVGVLMLLALTTTTSSKIMGAMQHSTAGQALERITGFVPFLGFFESFLLANVAYVIIWPAFIIIYAFVPNTTVRWRSAIAGGFVAGTLYQLVQICFIVSSGVLWKRYGAIYGSFAILFVMFFWIFISWMIVLWGAEVCASHQNLRDLHRRRREWKGFPFERETLALRLASLLAAPMIDGGLQPPMDAGDLADALCCPPEPLHETIELFRDHGLLVQSADDLSYRLARSPESVSVLDVLRLVRQGSLGPSTEIDENGMLDFDTNALTPLQRRCLSELARMPLEQIHAIRM